MSGSKRILSHLRPSARTLGANSSYLMSRRGHFDSILSTSSLHRHLRNKHIGRVSAHGRVLTNLHAHGWVWGPGTMSAVPMWGVRLGNHGLFWVWRCVGTARFRASGLGAALAARDWRALRRTPKGNTRSYNHYWCPSRRLCFLRGLWRNMDMCAKRGDFEGWAKKENVHLIR